MTTQASTTLVRSTKRGLNTIHALLGVQSVVIVLLSINRLSTLTLGYVLPNEFLRWVDFNNMLVLPLVSVVASYFLIRHLEANHPPTLREGRSALLLNVVFLVGVYLLAASYGDHEVTNYLNTRFCSTGESRGILCDIIAFNDDEFSHWVFFTGFVFVNTAIMLLQLIFPYRTHVTGLDRVLLVINGLFIALGVFANLAFEVIGLDLYVVALLALLSLALIGRYGLQPLLLYYATAYTLGLLMTAIYKAI